MAKPENWREQARALHEEWEAVLEAAGLPEELPAGPLVFRDPADLDHRYTAEESILAWHYDAGTPPVVRTLALAWERLTDRERAVAMFRIVLRDPWTQERIAAVLSISRQSVTLAEKTLKLKLSAVN